VVGFNLWFVFILDPVQKGASWHLAGFCPTYVVQPLGCSPLPLPFSFPLPFPAIQQISGAPTGRRIRGGGFYPGLRSAPTEPRLPWAILGCPFGAPNGQILKKKLKFRQKNCVFHAISSSFSVLLRQKQVVRNLVIAVYLLNQLPFFVSFVPFVVNGLFGRGLS
jgi:hypothetical protein